MRGRERNFFECDHLPVEACLTLTPGSKGHFDANIAIRKKEHFKGAAHAEK
jgi:hypothetical protein